MLLLEDLSDVERQVWDGFHRGFSVDLTPEDVTGEASTAGVGWGPDRTIRAKVVKALLLGGRDIEPGQVARLIVIGARIRGALDLSDAEIGLPVAFTRCQFDNDVTLANAQTRRVDLSGSWLPRLHARQARIDGDLVLRQCQIPHGINLAGAHIAGLTDLERATLGQSDGYALFAPRLATEHSIYCPHLIADGGIAMVGARIGGGMHMRKARVTHLRGTALDLSRTTIDDNIYLIDGCEITGIVRLEQTSVRGLIDLSEAVLINPASPVLIADNLTVDQNLICTGLAATGELRLLGAHIVGDFVLSGAQLTNPGHHAFDGGSLVVDRSLRCNNGFTADGAIRLIGARLSALELRPRQPLGAELDLRYAHIDVLRDDPAAVSSVRLDGLIYQALEPLLSVPARLHWLADDADGYRPLPYEQLATTYRRAGYDADARRVLLAKQRQRRSTLSAFGRAWGLLQDWTVGYGYLPGRAAAWLLALLAVGTAFFSAQPPLPTQHGTPFNVLIYTLDVLLPVVNFNQEDSFTPRGLTAQLVTYLLITAGWTLATTIATGITRTLRRT